MASDSREDSFKEFFKLATHGFAPYEWQLQVAVDGLPDVLPVPTGLGKTEVALAWAWRLLVDEKPEPRHLVVCLPMRSLVTQTVQRLKTYFNALKAKKPKVDVAVHQLMGGAIDDEWVGQPDKPWVLGGTQDQLLSRALNRGYAMSRFEWPVHFGLLNNDCRWLIDEVQLMGPGLWTTSQLDWMRRKRFPSLKPCLTTWMSATVDTSFLSTTDRVRDALAEPSHEQVAFEGKLKTAFDGDAGLEWWRAAKRPLAWWQPEAAAQPTTGGGKKRGAAKSAAATAVTPNAIAASVKAKHVAGTLSLVICNTVDMARAVLGALSSADHKVLLTSRFRREDRARHEQRLIDFDAQRKAGALPEHDPGLICVSTQVIEAGVDISAHRLFTELAPWPSMLQRLGRLNRKGDDQEAQAWVWETPKEGGNKKVERIGPYEAADLDRAKRLVDAFTPLSQDKAFSEAIAGLNASKQKEVTEALQPKLSPLPRALDVHGLFSTERDVHGGFTDVSAFVRGTDPDLDVTVFWRDWSGDSPPRGDDLDGPLLEPAKEGCPVSFVRVQKMLESSMARAWLWDDEAGRWERVNHWDIRPGMLVMLKRDVGGYDQTEGWTGDKANVLAEVPRAGRGATLRDDVWTEVGYWSKLEDHLKDARREAEELCSALSLTGDMRSAVVVLGLLQPLVDQRPLVIRDLSDDDLLAEETGARTTEAARSLITLTRAGNFDAVLRLASSRYAMAGARLATFHVSLATHHPDRLAAALLFTISDRDRAVLFERWLREARDDGLALVACRPYAGPSRAFDADEQEAILLAAARDVSWAAAGSDSDEWRVRLVPLDRAVPPPPGFGGQSSMVWESVTPYVPPRHHLRGGKEREGESMAEQIRREVQGRELAQDVELELVGTPQWVSVHVPRREANKRVFIGDRRGQMVRLRFSTPVVGPVRLGHSSSFGLGLFRPVEEPDHP